MTINLSRLLSKFTVLYLIFAALGCLFLAMPANSQEISNKNFTEIGLVKAGGTFKVPVLINGSLSLNFTVDSGAADVTIPADVVMTLMRTETVTAQDFIGTKNYQLADGSIVPSKIFRIHSLKFGDIVIENVIGSVGNVEGSLLLGQSFLSRFQRVSFDYSRLVLVLELASSKKPSAVRPPVSANPKPSLAGTSVDEGVVFKVAARFKAKLDQGGMAGVNIDIEKCYRDTEGNADSIKACMLYDMSAVSFDRGFRNVFKTRVGRDVGPVTPFFSEENFDYRMRSYSLAAFGNAVSLSSGYFGNAPDRVLERLIK